MLNTASAQNFVTCRFTKHVRQRSVQKVSDRAVTGCSGTKIISLTAAHSMADTRPHVAMSCTDVTRVTEERGDCGHLTGRRCRQGVVPSDCGHRTGRRCRRQGMLWTTHFCWWRTLIGGASVTDKLYVQP